MKLFRIRTLGLLGIGFLAGSAAGKGPWEKARASMDELRGKVSGGAMNGSTLTDSTIQGRPGGQGTGARQLTEM